MSGATVGPETPAAIRPLLRDLLDRIQALETPGSPVAVLAIRAADLPPPGAWPWRVVAVSDLNILAHSDGSHWIRQDTGGAI